MHIPTEDINKAIELYKENIHKLYQHQNGEDLMEWNKVYDTVNHQERTFKSLFGDEFLRKLNEVAWLNHLNKSQNI